MYNIDTEKNRMLSARPEQRPVEYIYLDIPGIDSLYAQIVNDVETSRVKTTQKGVSAKVGGGLKLKNFLVRLLSGLEGELSGEVSGSGTITEQSTRVLGIEHKLDRVRAFLGDRTRAVFFTDLGEASRQLQRSDGPVFVDVRDKFNAPQFYGGAQGALLVNADGYLLLEKGGAADYCDQDDYYKRSTAEVVFFRGFSGRQIPLNVFGSLSGTSDYMQIKPFAIWR